MIAQYCRKFGLLFILALLGLPVAGLFFLASVFGTERINLNRLMSDDSARLPPVAETYAVSYRLPAPDFELVSLAEGEADRFYRLSDYAGFPLLLVFWDHGCPSCSGLAGVAPVYQELMEPYGGMALGVSVGFSANDAVAARAYPLAYGITFPAGIDYSGSVARSYLADRYKPSVVLIDHEGMIAGLLTGWEGGSALRSGVEAMMHEWQSSKIIQVSDDGGAPLDGTP